MRARCRAVSARSPIAGAGGLLAAALLLAACASGASSSEQQPVGPMIDGGKEQRMDLRTAEWLGMYDEVRNDLIKIGLPLDRLKY